MVNVNGNQLLKEMLTTPKLAFMVVITAILTIVIEDKYRGANEWQWFIPVVALGSFGVVVVLFFLFNLCMSIIKNFNQSRQLSTDSEKINVEDKNEMVVAQKIARETRQITYLENATKLQNEILIAFLQARTRSALFLKGVISTRDFERLVDEDFFLPLSENGRGLYVRVEMSADVYDFLEQHLSSDIKNASRNLLHKFTSRMP